MINHKPEIVFTFPERLGGVSSFNYNIINNSEGIKSFYSKVILLKALEDNHIPFTDVFNVDEVITFNFSYKENQVYVKKRLSKLLGNIKGAIVTDNGLTISAAKMFNNPKTVFHLIHDFFYVNENVQMGDQVDVAVAHSCFFSDAVFASSPLLYAGRNFCIPYGVKQLKAMPVKNNSSLHLVFLGRLSEEKGVSKLYEIEKELKEKNIIVRWTIIGKGPLEKQLHEQWQGNTNIQFVGANSTREVYDLLCPQDVLVFPTSFEGTPVSILECLASGITVIVNDLPGGIRDIISEDIGFRCRLNNIGEFVEKIALLHNDRTLLKQLQYNCYALSKKNYDINKNADNYFDLFLQFEKFKRNNKYNSGRMSFLDKAIFPNGLVKFIRGIKKQI